MKNILLASTVIATCIFATGCLPKLPSIPEIPEIPELPEVPEIPELKIPTIAPETAVPSLPVDIESPAGNLPSF